MYVLFSHYFLFLVRKKIEWTPQEDSIINELQAKYGNLWAQIGAELSTTTNTNRTGRQVKKRWNTKTLAKERKDVPTKSSSATSSPAVCNISKSTRRALGNLPKSLANMDPDDDGNDNDEESLPKKKTSATGLGFVPPPLPPLNVTDAPQKFVAEV